MWSCPAYLHNLISHDPLPNIFPEMTFSNLSPLSTQTKYIFLPPCPEVYVVFGFTSYIPNILHIVLFIICLPLEYQFHMSTVLAVPTLSGIYSE